MNQRAHIHLALPALLWLAACSGHVVDTTGSGGASAQTGAGASAQAGVATTDPNNCAGVPDPAVLSICKGFTTGPPGNCDLTFCDPQANRWEEICVDGACQCKRNGVLVCSCSLTNLPAGCTGGWSCCFGTGGE